MQRKATKNTRGPNAAEKDFQGWLKEQPCAYCGKDGPSIVDHARGSTYRHMKTLIGHAFCTSKCEECDSHKTQGNHNRHFEMTGKVESDAWWEQYDEYSKGQRKGCFYESGVESAIWAFAADERRKYAS